MTAANLLRGAGTVQQTAAESAAWAELYSRQHAAAVLLVLACWMPEPLAAGFLRSHKVRRGVTQRRGHHRGSVSAGGVHSTATACHSCMCYLVARKRFLLYGPFKLPAGFMQHKGLLHTNYVLVVGCRPAGSHGRSNRIWAIAVEQQQLYTRKWHAV